MSTKLSTSQSVNRSALPMVGSAANDSLDTLLAKIDPELSKLFEDRNVLLTDGGLVTFAGTTVAFSEALNITINQRIGGGTPLIISLGSTTRAISASGNMIYAVIDRTAGTATVTDDATSLPAAVAANQEVFLIAKRVDAADGTKRLYFRNGAAFNEGQTARLGSAGSGSGSGLGDDLTSVLYRADITDTFQENSSNAATTINGASTFTNAVFSAAKNMYAVNYDASKTATSTGTAVTMSGAPAYTVVAGDVLVNPATGEVKKITVVTSQTAYTIESAFAANLATTAVCVSQAVHTKDVYNLSIDTNGNTLASAFPALSFSEISVFYKDNASAGSNTWAIDSVANAAFTASPDNSSWTIAQKRVQNITDTYQSTILPSAGTSLYLRFFSNKTSGSGVINLLMYKAYMQKAVTSGPQGGVQWAAYGTTNNSTTAIGCTISTVGGKTLITLTGGNQYAVGVNAGQTYGACDVLLNGQLLPRFVAGSVPATDSSFTEVSGTVIQLDKDYSSLQLEVQVLLRAQVVDASTSNTTNISALQDMGAQAFQAFVNTTSFLNTATSSAGTPAAGTFYSSIVGRASMPDLSQDLKVRFGIERIPVQTIYQLQNEFGPNGEPVWAVPNDQFGQIRFVGNWSNAQGVQGNITQATATTDFVEITFYGTGLNYLTYVDSGNREFSVSVDGGAPTTNTTYPSSGGNGVIQGRNYASNTVLNLVSGLTLGIHTVKMISATGNGHIYGFEILNQNVTPANVSVNSGISYVGGQKIASASQSLFAYNSVVTGVRGGRVLVYQKADGTIAQSFQAVNAASANLTSADHTNEEIARVYNFREFGAGRADDFSLLSVSVLGTAAFALEDDSTGLVGNHIQTLTPGTTIDGVCTFTSGTNGFITVTFVGTGLDVKIGTDTSTRSFTAMYVDGGSTIGTLSKTASTGTETRKIVSGLPYGTHTVKFENSSGTSSPVINQFIVYQPKKPALPAGAVELADYNVMATFVANSTNAGIATGTLRKHNSREFLYVGTGWAANSVDPIFNTVGTTFFSNTTNDYVQYTFFGTGFDFRVEYPSAGSTVTLNLTVDGASNLSGFTNGAYGGSSFQSWTPSTGTAVFQAPQVAGCGVYINGLTLGWHTVKVLRNAASGTSLWPESFDIITPIHSAKSNLFADLQNTLPVGSCAISDNRNITPLKAQPAQKAWAQATGITASPSTTVSAATPVPMPDMSVTIKTSGSPIQIFSKFLYSNNTSGQGCVFFIYVDGVRVSDPTDDSGVSGANSTQFGVYSMIVPVSAGTHRVEIYWGTFGTTLTASNLSRLLYVREL